MPIAFHFAIPSPPRPEDDAAVQDALRLQERVGGVINFLLPSGRSLRHAPRLFCGLHQFRRLRKIDETVDAHHVFSNGLYPYPFLYGLAKPVVYTSVIGLEDDVNSTFGPLSRVTAFTVSTEHDRRLLASQGVKVTKVLPGIPMQRFSKEVRRQDDNFVVMAGSAPWNIEQFSSKGFVALFEVAKRNSWLELKLLWRGKCVAKVKQLIVQYGIADRVELITDRVDVNKVLARSDAAVVLATNQNLVKGYPHSLLESMASGRPVLVSGCLAIAEYVEEHGCGVVVNNVNAACLENALIRLRNHYADYFDQVNILDLSIYSQETMVDSFLDVYSSIVGR